MTPSLSPERWACDITQLLNAAFGPDRFPVDVPALAREYSHQRYPNDPVSRILGGDLPGFDGALVRAPAGKAGWGIFYNDRISSLGRINFTLAHEFGHYLVHRAKYPEGIRCGEQDFVRWDTQYGQVEQQANAFAANFLMPLDDYRRQLPARDEPDLDRISECASRYKVSLIAAVLRWLGYTERRAVLVVSNDGFILWSRASEAALRTGAFFRTRGAPIELPSGSLAAQSGQGAAQRGSKDHAPGVWFAEPARELTVLSEQYGFGVTLLLLEDRCWSPLQDQDAPDVFDQMVPAATRRTW